MEFMKELLALQEDMEKKFVIIKVYYDYLHGGGSSEDHDEEDGDNRIPENGYINVKCESGDQAEQLMAALAQSKDWYLGAAMLVAEDQIDSEEQQTVEVQDGQDPDVELAAVANDNGEEFDIDEFQDHTGIDF